jgi:hypothetical protein
MQNRLAKTTFNINTQFFTFPANFIAPTWAKGYKCEPGKCGLCCLTAAPKNFPLQPFPQLDRSICAHYDIKRRLCKKHTERSPWCEAYPFLFGVEDGQVLISTCLECPTTSKESTIEPKVLPETFETPYFSRQLTLMNDCYEHAILSPNMWRGADHMWHTLTKRIQEFFSHKTEFPFLSELRYMIVETIAAPPRIRAKIPPIKKLVSQAEVYIATRFKSTGICLVKPVGSKTVIVLFDENLKQKKAVKVKTPTKTPDLEIKRAAHELLNDYVSLICNRPFLSLATRMCATIKPRPVTIYLLRSLARSFMPIEIGATVIATRDKLKAINRDTMREIISFSEAAMLSRFRRPK